MPVFTIACPRNYYSTCTICVYGFWMLVGAKRRSRDSGILDAGCHSGGIFAVAGTEFPDKMIIQYQTFNNPLNPLRGNKFVSSSIEHPASSIQNRTFPIKDIDLQSTYRDRIIHDSTSNEKRETSDEKRVTRIN